MTERAEVVVVGAGMIGLSLAWRCALAGLDVLVVDRADHPVSASWVAAGMLAPVTEVVFGEEALLEANIESARRYPAFLEELAESSSDDLSAMTSADDGTIYVAVNRDQVGAMRRLFEYQQSLGLQVEWLDADRCVELEPALHSGVIAGILAHTDRAADPRAMTKALRTALEAAGGRMSFTQTVTQVRVRGGAVTGVTTQDQEMDCATVVIAGGCWSGRIEGIPAPIASALRPVKGQILRLANRHFASSVISHALRSEEVYVVPRRSGELVVGATVEELGFDTSVTAGGVFELLRAATEIIPAVREFELSETAAGLRPGTPDNLPMVGATETDGLFIAAGHFRNGILLAPLTSDAIGEMIVQGTTPPEVAAFSPTRFS